MTLRNILEKYMIRAMNMGTVYDKEIDQALADIDSLHAKKEATEKEINLAIEKAYEKFYNTHGIDCLGAEKAVVEDLMFKYDFLKKEI